MSAPKKQQRYTSMIIASPPLAPVAVPGDAADSVPLALSPALLPAAVSPPPPAAALSPGLTIDTSRPSSPALFYSAQQSPLLSPTAVAPASPSHPVLQSAMAFPPVLVSASSSSSSVAPVYNPSTYATASPRHRRRSSVSPSASPRRGSSPIAVLGRFSRNQPRVNSDPITVMQSCRPTTVKRTLKHSLTFPRVSIRSESSASLMLSPASPIHLHTPVEEGGRSIVLHQPSSQNGNTSKPCQEIVVPPELIRGVQMFRITHKKAKSRTILLRPRGNTFVISWEEEKDSSTFDIDDITGIRLGLQARYYQNELCKAHSTPQDYARWTTIVYSPSPNAPGNKDKKIVRELHVIAESEADFRMFSQTVIDLCVFRQHADSILDLDEAALRTEWAQLRIRELPTDQVDDLLNKHNIHCSPEFLEQKKLEANGTKRTSFSVSEFLHLLELLNVRPEIIQIWETRCDLKDPPGMSFAAFSTFCRDVEKLKLDDAGLQVLFEKYATGDRLLAEGMRLFLLSADLPLITAPEQDLTHPLQNYFISSSHNTYLPGRQVLSYSSTEPYVRGLLDKCRCVEIDVWDSDAGPIVTHGRTFTSAVQFSSVVYAINEFAFVESQLPVILSFEIHCSPENQIKMVDIMKKVFGDKLVVSRGAGNMPHSFFRPCPEDLLGKILVKVKAATGDNALRRNVGQNIVGLERASSVRSLSSTVSASSSTTAVDDDSDSSLDERLERQQQIQTQAQQQRQQLSGTAKKIKSKISSDLGSLGVYFQGVKFTGFNAADAKSSNHIYSFNDAKVNGIIMSKEAGNQEDMFIRHNKAYFSRLYPHNLRIGSSNYDPIPYWRRGVQMVALNWQNYDTSKQLNDAMFDGTDGFVLKPSSEGATTRRRLTVEVLGLRHLPRPRGSNGSDGASGSTTNGGSVSGGSSGNGSGGSSSEQGSGAGLRQQQDQYNITVSIELFGTVERRHLLPKESKGDSIKKFLFGSGRTDKYDPDKISRAEPVWYSAPVANNSFNPIWQPTDQRVVHGLKVDEDGENGSSKKRSSFSVEVGNKYVSPVIEPKDYDYTFVRFGIRAVKRGHEEGGGSVSAASPGSPGVATGGISAALVAASSSGHGGGGGRVGALAVLDAGQLDDPSTLVAFNMARVASLNEGYRHVPLKDVWEGEYKNARLFVRIGVESVV